MHQANLAEGMKVKATKAMLFPVTFRARPHDHVDSTAAPHAAARDK